MAAWVAPLVGSLVSGGLGIAGAASEASDAAKQVKLANKQAIQDWRYDNRLRRKQNKWNVKDWRNSVRNEETSRQWQDRLAMSDWNYKTAMQDYEYKNQLKQYAQSEKNYKQQLTFNNTAAAQAYEAEGRKLEEIRIGQAFQSQEMAIETMIEEGQAKAKGQAGGSAAKIQQSIAASYGRNIAILEKSMESAITQYRVDLQKISLEKMGADLQAEAQRMIKPERMPSLPKPEALPVAKIVQPLKIPRKKKPIAAVAGSSTGAMLGQLAGMVSSATSIDYSK